MHTTKIAVFTGIIIMVQGLHKRIDSYRHLTAVFDEGVGSNPARCKEKISGSHLEFMTWMKLPHPLRGAEVKDSNTCDEGGGGDWGWRVFSEDSLVFCSPVISYSSEVQPFDGHALMHLQNHSHLFASGQTLIFTPIEVRKCCTHANSRIHFPPSPHRISPMSSEKII